MFERTRDLQLSVIKQMEIRAAKYPDVVSLAQGIPSFDTPCGIKRRAEKALERGVVAKYSLVPGLPELRELIEISLAQNNMFYDWQKEIVVTAGSIEGISATILAITSPGDEIILLDPTYTSYQGLILLAGCKPVFVSLNEEENWGLGLEKLERAITPKTRAILFCNPNNPTGTILNKKQLLAIGELALRHKFFILTDEVYKDFLYNDEPFFSLAELADLRQWVIRFFSFSKAYAMTGWRVGYLHSDEKNIAEILKVHDSLVTCAPVISQYAAMGALEMGEEDRDSFKKEYLERRELICRRLDNLSGVFNYIKPNSSYFVFPYLCSAKRNKDGQARLNSWDFALELLDKARVAVVPGIAFGPSGENHVRLSFGRSQADIESAFDRMDKFFNLA
jgi:aminotransferase